MPVSDPRGGGGLTKKTPACRVHFEGYTYLDAPDAAGVWLQHNDPHHPAYKNRRKNARRIAKHMKEGYEKKKEIMDHKDAMREAFLPEYKKQAKRLIMLKEANTSPSDIEINILAEQMFMAFHSYDERIKSTNLDKLNEYLGRKIQRTEVKFQTDKSIEELQAELDAIVRELGSIDNSE